jgi:NAD(P)-dependent dehydrogenase (short-subunit alcohol dehydrogenase family)
MVPDTETFIPTTSPVSRMTRPVILVTGSTDGIGKAAAIELAARGTDVVLHGRDAKKGAAVQREVEGKAGCERPDLVIADFAEQDQIRHMAADITSHYTRLDVLINNAGTYEKERRVTADGVEMTLAVNYLAPFLLTHSLLPLLKKSAPSRIISVASGAHEDVDRVDWDNLQGERHYDPWDTYARSKFADIVFTYLLARNIDGSGVTANCLHPGVVNTKMLRSAFPTMPGIPPEQGALTSVYLAVSPDVAGMSGHYFDNGRPVRSSALTYDRSVQERLWKMAEDRTGIRSDYQTT